MFKVPRTPTQAQINKEIKYNTEKNYNENRKKDIVLKMCSGSISSISTNDFITLFDTCNSFVSEILDIKISG